MYKLEFTLKQHTPIIHFQHDQDGATLRATEVKPKLDRFIIEIIKRKSKEIPKEWLLGEHESLNYKMKVLPVKSHRIIIANRMMGGKPSQSKVLKDNGYDCVEISPYFAQEKEFGQLFQKTRHKDHQANKWVNVFSTASDFDQKVKDLKTVGLYSNDQIRLEMTFYNMVLFNLVKESLSVFFTSTNFGTRQSKGFGSFLPINISDQEILSNLRKNPSIRGVFCINNNNNFKEKFKKISQEYLILKRGDSQGTYQKSKIWEYLCSSNKINWEKKAIKIHIKTHDLGLFNQLKYDYRKQVHSTGHFVDQHPKMDDFYIRALLGLAELYEFSKTNNERIKVKIGDALNYNIDPQLKSKSIDRFASPIRYFFSDTSIFLTTSEIPEELIYYSDLSNVKFRRYFRFTIDDMNANKYFDLPIPDNFNLEDFIEKKMNYGKNLK